MGEAISEIGDFFISIGNFFTSTWNLISGAITSVSDGWDFFEEFFLGAAPPWAYAFFASILTVTIVAMILGVFK